MKKIGMGLVGPGFVARHHIDAVRRLGDVDVIAIAGSSQHSTERKAHEYKVDRAYGNYEDLIADPDITVIHNTTPNHLHFAVSMAAFKAGKHVISDKPLALNSTEGRQLRDAALSLGSRPCGHLQLSRQSASAAGAGDGCERRDWPGELRSRPLPAGLDG